jgi:hypothetical protein
VVKWVVEKTRCSTFDYSIDENSNPYLNLGGQPSMSILSAAFDGYVAYFPQLILNIKRE